MVIYSTALFFFSLGLTINSHNIFFFLRLLLSFYFTFSIALGIFYSQYFFILERRGFYLAINYVSSAELK